MAEPRKGQETKLTEFDTITEKNDNTGVFFPGNGRSVTIKRAGKMYNE